MKISRILIGLAVAVSCGSAFGDGAQMPRALFEANLPGAADQLKVGGGAQGQVTWKVVENGFTAKLEPGKSQWPGVMVVPPNGKPNWDLSLWGHVEAKVTNLGSDEFQIFMRVDNPAEPGKSPWNTEPIKLKGGASQLVKVYFGYSFYHQPNYKLDQSNVVRVQFFLGNPTGPIEFKVENLKAAGWDGEKPQGYVDQMRTKPDAKGYAFKDVRKVAWASGSGGAQLIKPPTAFWDLSADMQVRVAVKNTGKVAASPRFRLDSVDGSTDEFTPEKPIAPGKQAIVTIPFAPKVPWTGVQHPDQMIREKGGRWDRQPGTGTAFRNHKVRALAVLPDPKAAEQSFDILAMKSENPPANKPAWLGKRPPVPGKWKVTLDEEFDQPKLNDKLFGVRWFNFWDKRMHFSADNTFIRDGKLVLRAEKKRGFHNDNPDEGKFPGTPQATPIETDWQTGWADSFGRFTQTYGYWEFRMKLPQGPCLWPGVWLMPDRGLGKFPQGFPQENWNQFRGRTDVFDGGMEIDIVESQTIWGPHRFNTACHWDGYGKEHKVLGTSANYIATDEEGFITIGMLWLPGEITMYGNGEPFWKWESPRVMSVPAYLQFQNQFGGWECDPLDPALFPSDFEVDYVRIWQREDLLKADEGVHKTEGGPDTRCRNGGVRGKPAGGLEAESAHFPPAKPLPPPAPSIEGPVAVCPNYEGKDAAFMLAFDDACVSHLEKAIPLLEKYRVPGTFYLITEAGQFTWKKPLWAKAAKSPYVFLGNHTSTHKGVNAQSELHGQAAAANAVIRELTPDQPWPRLVSFAIPGGVPWRVDAKGLLETLSAYDLVERPAFQGPPWHYGKIEEAEAYVDKTLANKAMGHIDFHGVGGDWHVTGLDYFERLLKKLDANRDRIWLCSAIDWHKYVTEVKYAQVKAVKKGSGYEVSLSVAPLDAKLYDHPLTVLVDGKTKVSLKPGEKKRVK
ncbi:MAG: polysaccharide deacetylase family protein [Kiritimatiellia bacterium]